MLLLPLDTKAREPLYEQMAHRIVELIDGGALAVGDRLPPSRALADTLGLNRSTVLRAYQELWALGYIESRPGSYTTVRQRARRVERGASSGDSAVPWEKVANAASRVLLDRHRRLATVRGDQVPKGTINFAGLAADRALAPVDDLRRAINRLLARQGGMALDYGDPAGYRPLREAIARRMQTHSVTVSPDEVLVTSGAQQAIDLVLRMLASPAARVVVEAPSYAAALPLFRANGYEPVEVPMRDDGMDLDALERAFDVARPTLVYTMPNFHNPTGITTSQPHRERLLALCSAHGIPLVEDGFEEEMKYFGRAVLPIKSMDHSNVVIYLGTFSKVLFPGLRIGWIAAHQDCIDRLTAIHRFASLSASTLGQVAIAHLCENGTFEAHLRRIHVAYRRRMQTLLRSMREHFPTRGVSWTEPNGGYTLWVRIERGTVTESQIVERLTAAKVMVAAGSNFFAHPPRSASFRLSISNLTEPDIEEGVRRIGRVLTQIVGG